jgi:hypothetical protein
VGLYPCHMALPFGSLQIDSGTVLIAIPLIVLPIAAISFARSAPAWNRLGKGPLAIEQELPPPRPVGAPPPPVDRAVQATEVRQMLEAKSYRRRRQGNPPIDVEAEMARILRSPIS